MPEGLTGKSQLHALIAGFLPQEWADLPPGEAACRVKIGIATERGPWVQALHEPGNSRGQGAWWLGLCPSPARNYPGPDRQDRPGFGLTGHRPEGLPRMGRAPP